MVDTTGSGGGGVPVRRGDHVLAQARDTAQQHALAGAGPAQHTHVHRVAADAVPQRLDPLCDVSHPARDGGALLDHPAQAGGRFRQAGQGITRRWQAARRVGSVSNGRDEPVVGLGQGRPRGGQLLNTGPLCTATFECCIDAFFVLRSHATEFPDGPCPVHPNQLGCSRYGRDRARWPTAGRRHALTGWDRSPSAAQILVAGALQARLVTVQGEIFNSFAISRFERLRHATSCITFSSPCTVPNFNADPVTRCFSGRARLLGGTR